MDTCIISELHGVQPEPVVSKVDALGEYVYISVVTISEMSIGAHSLRVRPRRRKLLDQPRDMEPPAFLARLTDIER